MFIYWACLCSCCKVDCDVTPPLSLYSSIPCLLSVLGGVSEGWSVELGYWLVSLLLQCDWRRLGKNPVICLLTFKAFLLYPCWLFPCPFQHPAACSFLRSIIGGAISAHQFHRDWVMDHFVIWWMLKCTSPNFSWAFCYWELGLCQGVLLKVRWTLRLTFSHLSPD